MVALPRSPLAPATADGAAPPVPGVRAAAVASGLRYKNRLDLCLIELPAGATVAGLLTTSATPGHPVTWCRRVLPGGRVRGVIVNAGNANVCNGPAGDDAVLAEVRAVAAALACAEDEVLVASTGIIGQRLDGAAIAALVPALVEGLRGDGLADAARAIMTTDTFPKTAHAAASIDGVPVRLTGIAKGSGMIAPDMATMLAFVATDARLPAPVLQTLLRRAADRSFHCTTVDSDTSTSDTLLLLASGVADHAAITDADDARLLDFARALERICLELALLVVRDGEGAEKLIEIRVAGAVDEAAARRMGLVIANSPLVKTAIAGGDANWGRVVMAVGKSGEAVEPARLRIAFGGTVISAGGGVVEGYDEAVVARHLAGREVLLEVDLGLGPGAATVWTCDLTHRYIDINADYRS
ncbi:MAG: bifunctional glutamate N-acetyltransferase/amino-acid acetyltransferase ArgJ [Geminicoccaceae bacterium]|nr:MAG: bifunctional glutamate N-acetyltransferase/amino-acid acetyltransferase ArgJ [Geminicoccaceae bacterium]